MTAQRLTRSELARLDSGVFDAASVVAIVPATSDVLWSADCAWEVARAAASDGRRVALVDLSLDRPALDRGTGGGLREGIVDAFLYGVSLGRVAQPQQPTGLHYIGVGTRAADPTEIWANSRWGRLTQGFARENALLLVFLPPNAIASIAFDVEGIVLLAKEGFDPYEHGLAELDRLLDGTLPVWVVEDNPVAAASAVVAEAPRSDRPPTRPGSDVAGTTVEEEEDLAGHQGDGAGQPYEPDLAFRSPPPTVHRLPPRRPDGRAKTARAHRRVAVAAVVVFMVAVGFMVGWPELQSRFGAYGADQFPGTDSIVSAPPLGASVIDTVPASTPMPIEAGPRTAAPHMDSLFYGVQVAAFSSYDRAMNHALEVGDDQLVPAVTPVRIGDDRLWYRVIVGAFRTSSQADSVLQTLWSGGTVEDGQGTVIRTPEAFDLGLRPTLDSAAADARGLRGRGLPAYVVRAPDGARVLIGAFQRPSQAGAAESLLTSAGITAPLVQRMGIRQ